MGPSSMELMLSFDCPFGISRSVKYKKDLIKYPVVQLSFEAQLPAGGPGGGILGLISADLSTCLSVGSSPVGGNTSLAPAR